MVFDDAKDGSDDEISVQEIFNDALGAIQSASIKFNQTFRDSVRPDNDVDYDDFQDAIGEEEHPNQNRNSFEDKKQDG